MITLTEVSKQFGDVVAVDNVDLSIDTGQIHGVLGRSGPASPPCCEP